MGKRGPPKKPTDILKARGSWRATDRKDAEMPPGVPEAPTWLQGKAREQWFHLMPMLAAAYVVRQTDGPALARYCQLWARWRDVCDWIAKYGTHQELKKRMEDENKIPVLDADGKEQFEMIGVCLWPQVKLEIRLAESLTRLEDRFGLTPSSRSSVGGKSESGGEDPNKSRFFSA